MIIIRSFTAPSKIFIERRAHLGAWLSTVASRGAGRSWARTLSWSHHLQDFESSFCFFSFNFSSFRFFHSWPRSVAGKSSQGYRTAWPLAQHQSLECLPQSQKGNQTYLWHMMITKRQSNISLTRATFGFQVDSCPRWSWASPCPPPQPHRPAHIHPPLLLPPQGCCWYFSS